MNIKIDKHLKSPKISAALFDLDGTILNQKEEIPEEIPTEEKNKKEDSSLNEDKTE